jgi:hypothetical protein
MGGMSEESKEECVVDASLVAISRLGGAHRLVKADLVTRLPDKVFQTEQRTHDR